MSNFSLRGRKSLALLVSAMVIMTGITASGHADAKPFFHSGWSHNGGGFGGHHMWGTGYGFGAAALLGGLALAGSVPDESACYVTRRPAEDEFGNTYLQRIRVCD